MRFAGHREWVGNFLHLVWMRGVNLILPLISIPYLMRVLGVDAWGRLYVAQSVQALALLLGESGLFLWAVREVALQHLPS